MTPVLSGLGLEVPEQPVLSGLDLEVPQHQFLVVLILRCHDASS